MGIIYLITNKQTGHKYVGHTTVGMNKQWQSHIQEAMRMSSKPLHSAMRQYGNHNFMIKEIDECENRLLEERKQYWIQQYNSYQNREGYNSIPEEEEEEDKATPIVIKERAKVEREPWGSFTDENRGNGKHCGIRIRSKNLKTGKIQDYENARIAANEITGNPNRNANILKAAKNGGIAYGHKWQLLEDKNKKKRVFGVNKKTEQIEVRYESIAEAIRELKENGRGMGIIKSLKHPGRYSWRGYYWFYG